MNILLMRETLDFIARFKPTPHLLQPHLMQVDFRLPREDMQDLTHALTELGLRYQMENGGCILCFERTAYEFLLQSAQEIPGMGRQEDAIPQYAVA